MDEIEEIVKEKFAPVVEFRESLNNETDRGCALMAAEYLSNSLDLLLRGYLVDDAKGCDELFENANGVLSTFSSRIEMAYMLGLIGKTARYELHMIRKIRNEFAHEYKPMKFTDPRVADRCLSLKGHCLLPDKRPRANFSRNVMGLLAILHAQTVDVKHRTGCEDVPLKIAKENQEDVRRQALKMIAELKPELLKGRDIPESQE